MLPPEPSKTKLDRSPSRRHCSLVTVSLRPINLGLLPRLPLAAAVKTGVPTPYIMSGQGRFPPAPRIPMAANHIFKVMLVNQGKVYEIYARKVSHGSLFGFVEVEELVFGERSTVVLDPGEERIKTEFEGVKRSYLPLQSVLRIDEVRKQGISKVVALEGGNVTAFPTPMFPAPAGGTGPKK